MSQIFHRSTNTLSRVSIYAAVFVLAGLSWVLMALDRSPYTTRQGIVLKQPVPFSHEHHVAGLGLDCRYCHTSVETSRFAGIPPTATCMNCHKLIWADSDMLEPVRASLRDDRPIVWTRVNDLPVVDYPVIQVQVSCPISPISITASTSRRGSAASRAMAESTRCR